MNRVTRRGGNYFWTVFFWDFMEYSQHKTKFHLFMDTSLEFGPHEFFEDKDLWEIADYKDMIRFISQRMPIPRNDAHVDDVVVDLFQKGQIVGMVGQFFMSDCLSELWWYRFDNDSFFDLEKSVKKQIPFGNRFRAARGHNLDEYSTDKLAIGQVMPYIMQAFHRCFIEDPPEPMFFPSIIGGRLVNDPARLATDNLLKRVVQLYGPVEFLQMFVQPPPEDRDPTITDVSYFTERDGIYYTDPTHAKQQGQQQLANWAYANAFYWQDRLRMVRFLTTYRYNTPLAAHQSLPDPNWAGDVIKDLPTLAQLVELWEGTIPTANPGRGGRGGSWPKRVYQKRGVGPPKQQYCTDFVVSRPV